MNLKVLVVDDDNITTNFYELMLSELQCEVKTASNGEEALRIVKESKINFDLFILDIEMPIMNGLELLQKIRSMKLNYTPIICGFSSLLNPNNYKQYGFDYQINKMATKNEIKLFLDDVLKKISSKKKTL